jgi:hypothetical protein
MCRGGKEIHRQGYGALCGRGLLRQGIPPLGSLQLAQRPIANQNDFLFGHEAFHLVIVSEDLVLLRTD